MAGFGHGLLIGHGAVVTVNLQPGNLQPQNLQRCDVDHGGFESDDTERCDLERCDLQHRAQQALAISPVVALRELRVEQAGSALHLHGLVASYYHKQLAQEVVRSVAGQTMVVNSIAVQ